MDENVTEKGLNEAIFVGAKAAREIGKSRERTFAIGEGLVAMRSQCLIAMGKSPLINDRSILKSGKYRELMGAALKRYPAYTLATVFKNDSTRLAYAFCAEYRSQIEALFAQEEIKNPGSTLRLTNPERIKSKFKSLTDPPKKKAATKAAQREEAAQEADMVIKKLKEDVDHLNGAYNDLFERAIDFDTTPADKLVELLLDTKAANRKNRLRFIDMVVEYATGEKAKPTKAKRQRKAKVEAAPAEGGFAPGVLETIQGEDKTTLPGGTVLKRKRKAKVVPAQSGDEGVSPLEGLSDGGSPYEPEEMGEGRTGYDNA